MAKTQLQVRCPNCGSYDTGISSNDTADNVRQSSPFWGCLSLGGILFALILVGNVANNIHDGNSPQTDLTIAAIFGVASAFSAFYFFSRWQRAKNKPDSGLRRMVCLNCQYRFTGQAFPNTLESL